MRCLSYPNSLSEQRPRETSGGQHRDCLRQRQPDYVGVATADRSHERPTVALDRIAARFVHWLTTLCVRGNHIVGEHIELYGRHDDLKRGTACRIRDRDPADDLMCL